MSVGQHEAVAVRPNRIVRIEAQKALPQRVNNRRQGHRCARVAGIRPAARRPWTSVRIVLMQSSSMDRSLDGCLGFVPAPRFITSVHRFEKLGGLAGWLASYSLLSKAGRLNLVPK